MPKRDGAEFEAFVRDARPRLIRALAPSRGEDAFDGASEAIGYAWEHWTRIREMENPVGYLYRVAHSRTRPRRPVMLPEAAAIGLPEIEPRLVPALLRLPDTQRTAVWLVHACQWSYAEVAVALDTSPSMIGNHVARGMARLRKALEVHSDA